MIESHVQTNGDPRETGAYMHAMVDNYWRDMLPWAHLGISEVFDCIKGIPFNPDPPECELLQRPKYTMGEYGHGGDCDDKSIALASYCRAVGIPYQFVAVRRRNMQTLHHVMCRIYVFGKWVPADPTYNFNALGRERETYAEYVII